MLVEIWKEWFYYDHSKAGSNFIFLVIYKEKSATKIKHMNWRTNMYQDSCPTTPITAFTLFGCPILSLLLSWQQKHSVFCRENCFYSCIGGELVVIFKFLPVSILESRYPHFFSSEFSHTFETMLNSLNIHSRELSQQM